MSCALLNLPQDVLVYIWSFLELPEIIRFGLATKYMTDFTWKYVRDLPVNYNPPIHWVDFVLSRDLSQIRSLKLAYNEYSGREMMTSEEARSKIGDLPKKILAMGKSATNLQSLSVHIPYHIKEEHEAVAVALSSLTQIQSFRWMPQDPDLQVSFAALLNGHSQLTSLDIKGYDGDMSGRGDFGLGGIGKLTKLKNLSASFTKADLLEVFGLTQLQSLTIAGDYLEEEDYFWGLTQLTNLEELELHRLTIQHASTLGVLQKLQKLTRLASISLQYRPEISLDVLQMIGRLSKLSSLTFQAARYSKIPDLGGLILLTNLRNLTIRSSVKIAIFSSFSKLTSLTLTNNEFGLADLPPNLEELVIPINEKLTAENIRTICGLSNLRRLQLSPSVMQSKLCLQQITQLTRLVWLNSSPSKELISAWQKLPNLVHLVLDKVPTEVIDDLITLTQLIQLSHCYYNSELRRKAPFFCRHHVLDPTALNRN